MTSFPDHPEAFASPWLAEKLGFAPDALRAFTYEPVGTGQVGDSYRLRLDWRDGDGPATIIAKVSAADATSRETARNMNLYEIEANWYRDYAAHVGVRSPYAYFVGLGESDIGSFVFGTGPANFSNAGLRCASCRLGAARGGAFASRGVGRPAIGPHAMA
jgi:hypothetical protein